MAGTRSGSDWSDRLSWFSGAIVFASQGLDRQHAALSASSWASLDHPDALAELEESPGRWARFLDHEVAACAEPGAWDGGTHLLFACR